MSSTLDYIKNSTVIQCASGSRPRPRPPASWPMAVFPGDANSFLQLTLQGVSGSGTDAVVVKTSAVLPGTSAGAWTLFWAAYQGSAPSTFTWNSQTFDWVTGLNLTIYPPNNATVVCYLQRVEADQTFSYAQVTISTPVDPTQGNLAAAVAGIAALDNNGILSLADKPAAISDYAGLNAQVTALRAQATAIGATLPAQNTLLTYLQGLGTSPTPTMVGGVASYAWNDATGGITVIPSPSAWTAAWTTIYAEIAALQTAISTATNNTANAALASGTNLVPNWDSELGIISGAGGSQVYHAPGAGYNGSNYVRSTKLGNANGYFFTGSSTNGLIPCLPGDIFSLSGVGMKKMAGNATVASLSIQFFEADGVTPAPSGWFLGGNAAALAVGVWNGFATIQATAPANTAFIRLATYTDETGAGDYWFDNISLMKLPAIATTGLAGVVKVGSGLAVAADGTVSVTAGAGGASTWGSITGSLSTQTDLVAALAAKASLAGAAFTGPVSAGAGFTAVDTSPGGTWISQKTDATVCLRESNTQAAGNSYRAFVQSTNLNYTLTMGRLSNSAIGFFGYNNGRSANGTDFSAYLDVSNNWNCGNLVAAGTGLFGGNLISATELIAGNTANNGYAVYLVPGSAGSAAALQAIQNNVAYTPLAINPNGGTVSIGGPLTGTTAAFSASTGGPLISYYRSGVSAKSWGFESDNSGTYWSNITDGILALSLSNAGNAVFNSSVGVSGIALQYVNELDATGGGDIYLGYRTTGIVHFGNGVGTQINCVTGQIQSVAARYSSYDLNSPTAYQIFDTYAPANAVPNIGASWHSVMVWPSADNNYITELANAMVGDGELYVRTKQGTWGAWREIYTTSNINTSLAATQALAALTAAPQWVTSLPSLPNSQYPSGTAGQGPGCGCFVALTTTKQVYQNQYNSWVAVGSDSAIIGQLTAASISAGSIGATALASVIAMTSVLTSTTFTAGTSTAAPSGFKFSGAPYTATCYNGGGSATVTHPTVQAELGTGISLGGYDLSTLALARLVNGGVQQYLTAGTYYWTCPPGIFILELTMVGGGGSGSVGSGAYGQGGFGAYLRCYCHVTPGTTYTIVVGGGGASVTSGNGNAGGNSTFNSADGNITVGGGAGGFNSGSFGQGGQGGGITTPWGSWGGAAGAISTNGQSTTALFHPFIISACVGQGGGNAAWGSGSSPTSGMSYGQGGNGTSPGFSSTAGTAGMAMLRW